MSFVCLTELYEREEIANLQNARFHLREAYINVDYIISIREEEKIKNRMDLYNLWPDGLDHRAQFTRLVVGSSNAHSAQSIVVAAALPVVLEKIQQSRQ